MAAAKSIYQKLTEISIKSKVERKGNLDYLSWANAWDMLKKEHPTAQRKVYESEHTGLNYFTDGKTAYVKVGITIGDMEHIDYLPVMDYRNNSISLDKVTSTDVNKTIQRSTAKAIAMHGLGLSLWTGEDVPELQAPAPQPTKMKSITLNIGDDNWVKVLKYVADNKELGLTKIVEQLKKKYSITAPVKKEIGAQIKKK
ncbi:MAG: DUF1071 domain-containing protein [Desulfobacterales bacterium]|jgi:hypothetical protein|nr:DUF1071 domain-containing protein [Desulfobacterales bacterium]